MNIDTSKRELTGSCLMLMQSTSHIVLSKTPQAD